MNDQNPTSLKTRFALRFIRSLRRIQMDTPTISSMPTLQKRSQMIKLAADASMASAVGSKRCWSRALLFKIRNRARLHVLAKKKMPINNNNNKVKDIKKNNICEKDQVVGEDELRQVVPGGESMDLFRLLEETAHYMKCLNTQVEVMQSIVDLYSPSSTN